MIHLVTRQNIDMFERMVEGLERPLTKTSLGRYWTIQDAYDHLVNISAFGFYQEESGYSGIMCINTYPQRKTLNIFWAGKERANKTPIDDAECDAFFDAIAKHFGCSAIMIQGRKGWEKMALARGYHEDSRVYLKEV